MLFKKAPSIIIAEAIEGIETDIVFSHRYLQPISPSTKKFKRHFLVERKDAYYIAGIQFHSYKDIFLDYKIFGIDHYNEKRLELAPEPWNKYDKNAIAIRMMGSKLGYIERDKTREVWNIIKNSQKYQATFDCSVPGMEMINIVYLKEFHNAFSLPYQSDVVLKAECPTTQYEEYVQFIKGNIGHAVSFGGEVKSNMITICTDMDSVIGYIEDTFIAKQYRKTPIAGFIENVITDDESKSVEIYLRLLMKKSVINKIYLESFKSLENHFGSFYDAGTYSITLADLVKIVPRKSRSISAYEPLVKYLKEYHAITLNIVE